MKSLAVRIIDFYQTFLSFDRGVLSVFAPLGACRYDVSCSEFTKQSILKYGILSGVKIGLKRIWSCK